MSTKTKTIKPPRRAAGAIKALAVSLGLTPRRCQQLLAAGMPDDPAQATAWRMERENSDTAAALRKERIKLVRTQREKMEIELARSKGEVIERAEVKASDEKIAHAVSAFARKIENELPQLLLGLPLERGRPICKQAVREMLVMLKDEQSQFWKLHPATDGK